jgi:hypothetical protein
MIKEVSMIDTRKKNRQLLHQKIRQLRRECRELAKKAENTPYELWSFELYLRAQSLGR